MANPPLPYRRIPGRGSGVISFVTLWEGDTHLLQVTSWPAGESYRRFFFADIQALILRHTARRMVLNIILGVFILLSLLPMALRVRDEATLITSGVIGACCLIFLLVNSLLGPTCVLQIQTAIQCEKLATVRRQRDARKLLARLQPLIAAAQPQPAAEATISSF